MKKKRKFEKREITLYLSLLIALIEPIMLIFFPSFSNFLYRQPDNINTVLDFENVESDASIISPFGEYEFYYNQWLITDNLNENEIIQDGNIIMPSTWTGKNIVRNNKKLTLNGYGYATYRVYLNNLKSNLSLNITRKDYGDSIRVFIDNELIYTSGFLSKDYNKNDISINNFYRKSINITEQSNVALIIEVGNNGHGGLQEPIMFSIRSNGIRYNSITEAIIFFILGLVLISCLIGFIFTFSKAFNFKTAITALLLFVEMLFLILTSIDGITFFNKFKVYPDYFTSLDINYALFCIFILTFCVLMYINKTLEISKKEFKFVILLLFFSVLLNLALDKTYLDFLSFIPCFICFIYLLYLFFKSKKDYSHSVSFVYLLILELTFGYFLTLIIYKFFPIYVRFIAFSSISIAIISSCFLVFYFYHYTIINEIKREQEKLYKEKVQIQERTLREEIKPHYLFNTLSIIKYTYHKDSETGDEMVAKFSDHYRHVLKTIQKDMHPFEDEIELINQYINLENIKFENKPFNLILNLEFEDFKIPPLTIEPLVENSVNYSKVNEKDDGYIEISSYLENNTVIIEVCDNGIGYNQSIIKNTSVGQRNLTERLKLKLNAKVEVISEVNNGCKTIITFPYKGDTYE